MKAKYSTLGKKDFKSPTTNKPTIQTGGHSSARLPKPENTGLVTELKNIMLLGRTWSHEELYEYLYYPALLDLSSSPLPTLHVQSTTFTINPAPTWCLFAVATPSNLACPKQSPQPRQLQQISGTGWETKGKQAGRDAAENTYIPQESFWKTNTCTKLRTRFQVFFSFRLNTCPSYSSFADPAY